MASQTGASALFAEKYTETGTCFLNVHVPQEVMAAVALPGQPLGALCPAVTCSLPPCEGSPSQASKHHPQKPAGSMLDSLQEGASQTVPLANRTENALRQQVANWPQCGL